MMTRLEERRDRLAALPSTPARIEYRPRGRTFADRWQEADEAGRRQLMVTAGFQVCIARTPITPAAIAAEARRQGITKTTRELRNRAANLRFMATKTTNPERLAVLTAELETSKRCANGSAVFPGTTRWSRSRSTRISRAEPVWPRRASRPRFPTCPRHGTRRSPRCGRH